MDVVKRLLPATGVDSSNEVVLVKDYRKRSALHVALEAALRQVEAEEFLRKRRSRPTVERGKKWQSHFEEWGFVSAQKSLILKHGDLDGKASVSPRHAKATAEFLWSLSGGKDLGDGVAGFDCYSLRGEGRRGAKRGAETARLHILTSNADNSVPNITAANSATVSNAINTSLFATRFVAFSHGSRPPWKLC